MMMKYVMCVAIVAVSLRNVRGLSKEEAESLYKKILPAITECSKEVGVADDVLKGAMEKHSADGIDNCFFACIFKKIETMDDKGMFNPDKALELINKDLSSEDDIKAATETVNDCKSVNDEEVKDGDAGCERAKLMIQCLAKHKHMFGLDLKL